MPDNDFLSDDEIIDLTELELIESGDNAKSAAGAAAYARGAKTSVSSGMDDDFESFLAAAENGDGHQAPKAVNADEELDMSAMGDIDNLLESLNVPEQPKPSAPPSKPSAPPQPTDDNLDNLLDDLLSANGDSQQRPTPSPDRSAPPVTKNEADDLMDSLDTELSNILDEAESSPASKMNEQTGANAQLPPLDEPSPEDSATVIHVNDHSSIEQEEPGVPPMEDFPQTGITAKGGPEIISHVITEDANSAAPATHGPYPVQPLEEKTLSSEMLSSICNGILRAQESNTGEALRNFAHTLGSQSAHIENLIKNVDKISEALQQSERELSIAREKLARIEQNWGEKKDVSDLFVTGTEQNSGFLNLLASAVKKGLENNPAVQLSGVLSERLQTAETQIGDILNQLDSLSSRFDPLQATIGELINNADSSTNDELTARIQSLETQESGILTKFASLEGQIDALQAGVNAAPAQPSEEFENLLNRIEKLEKQENGINARLDVIEQRLDELEPRFNEGIEKAAARAVAKILHEEISRLTGQS